MNEQISTYRQATDAAGLCRDLVVRTASTIQGRKYVRVEGWQAIANSFGCVASARDVRKVDGGYSAVGFVRRISDGVILAEAEGFLGDDEKTWANRDQFAKRAMAQTRAISRACRSAFGFVVSLMDCGLQTTPAEEMDGVDEPRRLEAPKKNPSRVVKGTAAPAGNPFEVATGLIQQAKTPEDLEKLRDRVEERLKDKSLTPFEADSLFGDIDGRLDEMEAADAGSL